MGQIVFLKFKGKGREHIEPERKIKQTRTMFIINYNYKVVILHSLSSCFRILNLQSSLVAAWWLEVLLQTLIIGSIQSHKSTQRSCKKCGGKNSNSGLPRVSELPPVMLVDLRLSKRVLACAFVFQSSFRPRNYTQSIKLVFYQSYQIFTHEEHINIYS